jgi:hypothetical protein
MLRLFTQTFVVAWLTFGLWTSRQELLGQDRAFLGWVSDERCARGRAQGDDPVYTGTNPDCARRCVREGRKIVLIVPDQKRILDIENQDAVRDRIGDYVEVSGHMDIQKHILHVSSIKLITEGRPMCDPPRKNN